MGLDSSRMDATIGQVIAGRMAEHVRMHRRREPGDLPARVTILRTVAVVIGPSRSLVNTRGDFGCARRRSRNTSNSASANGLVAASPRLQRLTCNVLRAKAT
jgi:hypothetical protein